MTICKLYLYNLFVCPGHYCGKDLLREHVVLHSAGDVHEDEQDGDVLDPAPPRYRRVVDIF